MLHLLCLAPSPLSPDADRQPPSFSATAVSLSISSASGVRIQPASVATSRSITDVAPPGTDESARRATAAAGQEAAASAGCLLVAEDDKLSQLVVKKTLVQAGFECARPPSALLFPARCRLQQYGWSLIVGPPVPAPGLSFFSVPPRRDRVVLVENGQLAVDAWLADPTRFSVIILDHNMNVMNGEAAPSRRIMYAAGTGVLCLLLPAGRRLRDI